MRRYELMLVLRPDAPDERVQAVIDRTTRGIVADGGSIVKVAPWGRRRLAYPIDRHREGSYHIVLFEAPTTAMSDRSRHLAATARRRWRPARPPRRRTRTTIAWRRSTSPRAKPLRLPSTDEDQQPCRSTRR